MVLLAADAFRDGIAIISLERLELIGWVDFRSELHKYPIGPRELAALPGSLFCANAYDDTVSFFSNLEEIGAVEVGAYPVSLACDRSSIKVCCGESDSIWSLSFTGEPLCCFGGVDFPYAMTVNEQLDRFLVCGIIGQSAAVYDCTELTKLHERSLPGVPMGCAFDGKDILINQYFGGPLEKGGIVRYNGQLEELQRIPLGYTLGRVKVDKDLLLVHVDDECLYALNRKTGEIRWVIETGDLIDDFVTYEDGICISTMMNGQVLVYDRQGKKRKAIPIGGEPRGLCLYSASLI